MKFVLKTIELVWDESTTTVPCGKLKRATQLKAEFKDRW